MQKLHKNYAIITFSVNITSFLCEILRHFILKLTDVILRREKFPDDGHCLLMNISICVMIAACYCHTSIKVGVKTGLKIQQLRRLQPGLLFGFSLNSDF